MLQEPIVFAATLADNIRYGAPDADAGRVQDAARAAMTHDLGVSLTERYDTIVGEGGHKLSQGERQRLAIARAFCTDPAMVVLDEATRSLDEASEAAVQAALANLRVGRTSFTIAHRLAAIVDADLIVVMDGGLVVQVGAHDELIAEEGSLYRLLCARQFCEPIRFGHAASYGPMPRRMARRRGPISDRVEVA